VCSPGAYRNTRRWLWCRYEDILQLGYSLWFIQQIFLDCDSLCGFLHVGSDHSCKGFLNLKRFCFLPDANGHSRSGGHCYLAYCSFKQSASTHLPQQGSGAQFQRSKRSAMEHILSLDVIESPLSMLARMLYIFSAITRLDKTAIRFYPQMLMPACM
jgi:hypothetical protein